MISAPKEVSRISYVLRAPSAVRILFLCIEKAALPDCLFCCFFDALTLTRARGLPAPGDRYAVATFSARISFREARELLCERTIRV